jgi:hypothetical protein
MTETGIIFHFHTYIYGDEECFRKIFSKKIIFFRCKVIFGDIGVKGQMNNVPQSGHYCIFPFVRVRTGEAHYVY